MTYSCRDCEGSDQSANSHNLIWAFYAINASYFLCYQRLCVWAKKCTADCAYFCWLCSANRQSYRSFISLSLSETVFYGKLFYYLLNKIDIFYIISEYKIFDIGYKTSDILIQISYILYKISDIIYEISYLLPHIRYLIYHIR